MKLKKTLGRVKPRTAKSEEKFKESDIVPSFASQKSPHACYTARKTSKSQSKLKKGVSIPSDASVSITCPCYLAFCCCCRRRTGRFRGAEGASSCWGSSTPGTAAATPRRSPASRLCATIAVSVAVFFFPANTGQVKCSPRGSHLTACQFCS